MKNDKKCVYIRLFSLCILLGLIIVIFCLKMQLEHEKKLVAQQVTSWERCLMNLNINSDIVFLGDSITMNHNFQNDFPDYKVVNLGCSGDSVSDISERIEMVAAVKPNKIFVMAGINGLARNGITSTLDQYESLLKRMNDLIPDCEIIIQNVLPVRNTASNKGNAPSNYMINSFNMKLKELCMSEGYMYIDLNSLYKDKNGELVCEFSEDGLHIKDIAYGVWVDAVKPYVE